MSDVLFTVTLLSALGAGVTAGVFFAFSTFVMKALGRLPAPQGIAAMQAINAAAPNPAFMVALFGTAVASIGLGIASLFMLEEPFAIYLLAGSVLYLVGPTLLTIAYHVPRNNALANVEPGSAGGERHWAGYLVAWTRWNHVRSGASLAAAALLTLALPVG
jgi:uncharacterized membrane protein